MNSVCKFNILEWERLPQNVCEQRSHHLLLRGVSGELAQGLQFAREAQAGAEASQAVRMVDY